MQQLTVRLVADISNFSRQIAIAGADVKAFGTKTSAALTSVDASARQMQRTVGLASAALGGALVLGLGLATKSAIGFEASMRNANTILRVPLPGGAERKLTEKEFQNISKSVVEMSTRVPQSAKTLSAGLYDIASSGFQGADAMSILRVSAVAATAGLTDTATAARAVVSVLNAYGKTAGHATEVSDILFQTVNLGVITFDELANTIGDFAGTAAQAGVPIADATAALAAMTLAGLNGAEAGVSLNRTMQALIKPSDALAQELNKAGLSIEDLKNPAIGLSGIMQQLQKDSAGNIQTLIAWFPELRAARGALALMANGGESYSRVLKGIQSEEERAGATQAAFNEQSKSTAFQLGLAKNQIGAFGIEIGTTMIPLVKSAAGELIGLLTVVRGIPGPVKTAGVVILGLAAAVALAGGAYLAMVPKIIAYKVATGAASSATSVLLPSLSSLVPVMAGVGAALTLGTFLLAEYGRKKAAAKADTEDFAAALREEAEAQNDATNSMVIQKLAQRGLIDDAKKLGINVRDVIEAAKGNADAQDRVTAALDKQKAAAGGSASLIKQVFGGGQKTGRVDDLTQFGHKLDSLNNSAVRGTKIVEQEKVAHDELAKKLGVTASGSIDAANGQRELEAAMGGTSEFARQLSADLSTLNGAQQTIFNALKGGATLPSVTKSSSGGGATKAPKAEGKTEQERATEIARAHLTLERSYRGVADAQQRAIDAQETLDRARDKSGQARVLARAELDLAAAYDDGKRAVLSLVEANKKLQDLRDRDSSGRNVAELQQAVERATIRSAEATQSLADAQETLNAAQDHGTPEELAKAQRAVRSAQLDVQDATWAVTDAQKALADAQGQGGTISRELAGSQLDVAAAQRALTESGLAAQDAAQKLADEQKRMASDRDLIDATKALTDAQFDMREALLSVTEAQIGLANSQKKETVAGASAASSSVEKLTKSIKEYQKELEQNIKDQLSWGQNLSKIAADPKYGPAVAAMLAKLGRDGAGYVAQLANDSKGSFAQLAKDMEFYGILGSDAYNKALVLNLGSAKKSAADLTHDLAVALNAELGIGIDDAEKLLKKYSDSLDLFAQRQFGPHAPNKTTDKPPTQNLAPKVGYGVNSFQAEGDIYNAHAPQMAKGGEWRVWAEPETQGESYIPHANDHRRSRAIDIWKKTGKILGIEQFASGGLNIAGLAPTAEMFKSILHVPIQEGSLSAAKTLYAAFAQAMGQQIAGGGGLPGGLNGVGYQAILDYMTRTGIPYTATSTIRNNSITSSGNISLHDPRRGAKAADLIGPDKLAIFRALLQHADQLQELFYTPAGFSIKNSKRVAPIAAADHYSHVHAATYDRGGWLMPGYTMAYNGTGRPESVGGNGGVSLTIGAGGIRVEVKVAGTSSDAGEIRTAVVSGVNDALGELRRELVSRGVGR